MAKSKAGEKKAQSKAESKPSAAKVERAAPIDEAWVAERTKGLKGEVPALGVPLAVFLGECVDCAKFVRAYWEPTIEGGKVIAPGMKSAAKAGDGEAAFGLRTADEILALHERAQAAQTQYLLATKITKTAGAKLDRANELLDAWTAALEWAFDDGVNDDKDAQLAAVKNAHSDRGESIDEVASALNDFAALAQKYLGELDGVLDFDPATLDEGLKLSKELAAINATLESNPEADKALVLRNNLLTLLHARVARVRRAALLVFRAHSEIARKVTSAYQRRARAMARREATKGEPKP
ncbi:MAG: hypothetical protein U0269_13140 [Polyangiales bacterium]